MRRVRISLWVCVACLGLIGAFAAGPAEAQVAPGVQAGVSVDPDQFYFGGHVETSPLVDRVRFRPNVDIGLGDDVTLIAFNFDMTYTFESRGPWGLYAGAGPAINWFDFDTGSEAEAGFNLLAGAKHRNGMFFEMRIGMMESPNLKFGVGYTFR